MRVVGTEQVVLILLGALAGGIVNGLTGFGTALTALGIWIYAIPPTVAASLAIICSVVSQTQTLHLIWRKIDWKRVLVFVVPGLIGVPFGTLLLPHIDPKLFKFGIGCFLVVYPSYVLIRKRQIEFGLGRHGGQRLRRIWRRRTRRNDRIVRRAAYCLDRHPRLEQGRAAQRRPVLQYGDPFACAGLSCHLRPVDAASRLGRRHRASRHNRRRLVRRISLPAAGRSRLSANRDGAASVIRNRT